MFARYFPYASLIILMVGGVIFYLAADDSWLSKIEVPAVLTSEQEGVPWTGTEAMQGTDDFSFVVVTDRTGGHREGVFSMAMDKINLVQPAFVVSVGDLIEGYTNNRETLETEWQEIGGFVARLQMPFFYAAGNHDMSNEVMAEVWQRKFGHSYYHFRYKDALFLVLNSELFGMVHDRRQPVPGPWTLAAQMQYAEQALRDNEDVRWTFVFTHQPIWDWPQIHPEWERLETMLAERKHTVFSGHQHSYTLHRRNKSNYITLATTGGSSDLRGTVWGEFDHVSLVRMSDDGPAIANLELAGIHPVDVRTVAERELVRAMTRAVEVLPSVRDEERLIGGTAAFKVTNSTEQEMHLVASFAPSTGYLAGDEELEITVPPQSVRKLQIPLRMRGRKLPDIGSMSPLRADFALSAVEPEAGRQLDIAVKRSWVADYPYGIIADRGIVEIDGDFSDWDDLRFEARDPVSVSGKGHYEGADDLSFAFDLKMDSSYLYALIGVRDDSLVSSDETVARLQDMVTLVLDVRPEPELSRNFSSLQQAAGSGLLARLILPMIPLGESQPDAALALFGVREVPGLRKAVKQWENGYTMEVAIPRQLLVQNAGGEMPERVRWNVIVTDFDEGEEGHNTISWRTPRYEEGAIYGSGIFQMP